MLEAFAVTYLGAKDGEYYKFVAERFSDEEQYLFIKEKMNGFYLGSIGFADCMKQILSYDMPIAWVCSAFLEMDSEKRKQKKKSRVLSKYLSKKSLKQTSICQRKTCGTA